MGVTDVAAVARGDTDSETGGVDRQVVSCGSAAGGRRWVWSTPGRHGMKSAFAEINK